MTQVPQESDLAESPGEALLAEGLPGSSAAAQAAACGSSEAQPATQGLPSDPALADSTAPAVESQVGSDALAEDADQPQDNAENDAVAGEPSIRCGHTPLQCLR